jgi:signal transduction histidine kinase
MVLERNGVPVGALVFDEALRDQPQLLAAVRSATSLALDNQNMEQQLRDQLVEVRRSRERIVTAGDARRRELERDLHDGAQQRLVAVSMDLARARRAPGSAEMRELVERASDELAVALAELRELARGVYPPSLQERGLGGSLTALAERSALPIELDVELPHRPPPPVELAAYFICAEAVTNAAKHSRASNLKIGVKGTETGLSLYVTDDGIGGASPGAEGGLLGLADRAAALGGALTVTSPEGRGTTVAATLPFSADPTEDMP